MSLSHDHDWYYSITGTSVGPVHVQEIRTLVTQGSIGAHHNVRHGTWSQWTTVREAAQQLGLPAGGHLAPAGSHTGARTATAGRVSATLRVASWAIDAIALGFVLLALNALLPTVVATFLAAAAFAAYTVWLPLKGIPRLGHLAIGLRVERLEPGEPMDWLCLATRAAVVLLLAAPCMVGAVCSVISMFAHDRAQAWHDVASGTRLVRARPWAMDRSSPAGAARTAPP